jgi:hypothetical protein
MKAAWVRPGSPIPDGQNLVKHGITDLVWDATDPFVTADSMEEVWTEWRFRPWLTRSADWDDVPAATLAQQMDDDIERVQRDNRPLGMIADIEALWRRTSVYVVSWLRAWRVLRPTRRTAWTTEPFQGGAISDGLAALVNSDVNLLVVPQLYFGNMAPAVESQVAMELIQTDGRRPIRRDRLRCYYDAARLPAAWDGFAYDEAKLPRL